MSDLERAALNPKVRKLMDEAENKSDQLDILIALASRQCDVSEALYGEFVAHRAKWCNHNKRSSKFSVLAICIASVALIIDLMRPDSIVKPVLARVIDFVQANWYLFFG